MKGNFHPFNWLVKSCFGTLLALMPGLCQAQFTTSGTLYTIRSTGPVANRLNVVFFSEGYTTNDLANHFLADVTNAMNNLFYFEPLQEYQTYCNVYAIAVPSINSGSTHPYFEETNLTFFGTSYDPEYNYVIDLPTSGLQKMTNLLTALMPQCGLPIVLVNDVTDGGAGGPADVISRGPTQADIEPHETGHTLGRLEDEYDYGYSDVSLNFTKPAANTAYIPNSFTNLVWSPSLTNTYSFLSSVTWGAWITNGTLVPTLTGGGVGLYLGANYSSNSWFRPQSDCMMRTLGSPFCAVCSEALVKAIYEKVRPIDSYSPATNSVLSGVNPQPVIFTLTEPTPFTHVLTTQWYTNGIAVAGATSETLTLQPAQYLNSILTVQAVVQDQTALVLNDPSNLLSETLTWNLTVGPPDTTPPVLHILTPSSNARYSNNVVTFSGTASDNVQVASVWCNDNHTGWINPSGTTNWSTIFSVLPGTNVLQAYAMDSSGNNSATSSVSIFGVVTTPLTVQTNGLGTITPSYNGQSLVVGQNYSLTAKPATGFTFANWTGGTNGSLNLLSSQATLTFLMEPNLTVQANFVDVTRPTLSITNLSVNQRVSNAVFSVQGKSSDNAAVATVWYSLNGSAWSTAAGTSPWVAPIMFVPGTNLFQAYAEDTSGNLSLTSSVSVFYVLSTPLTVQTNGLGSISPSDNGQLLALGQSYSLTAKPGSGFVFTNWTGTTNGSFVTLTNKATLTFLMQSNLIVQANFADVTRPLLSITNLSANQRVSNAVFSVIGKASDNAAVSNVWFSLNGSAWSMATGTNPWVAPVTFVPGTNKFQAYAVDSSANDSLTSSVNVFYVLSTPLTVLTNGQGTISPSYNGQLLALQQSYSLTAKPATGFAFTNWTGTTNGSFVTLTNKATLTFLMQSNLIVQANFADVTRPTLSITNLSANQRVSNAVFSVIGKASDNAAVSNVWFSLNGSAWSTASGTNPWIAPVTFVPGTNIFQAYAEDTSGNDSLTNTVACQLVVTNPLTVLIQGLGAISPNDTNAWLELGRNYSLTANPASGFVFTNWSGGTDGSLAVLTNKSTVTFLMQPNLTLAVNFTDVTRPTLTVTTPVSNQHLTNGTVNLVGTARDNWAVSNVWYQLNGGTWIQAVSTNSYTNWFSTSTLTLPAGTNTVKAYAQDFGGNSSLTNTVNFFSTNTAVMEVRFALVPAATANEFKFNVQLPSNTAANLQYSTDLIHWNTLTNVFYSNSSLNLTNLGITNSSQRFYRAVIP